MSKGRGRGQRTAPVVVAAVGDGYGISVTSLSVASALNPRLSLRRRRALFRSNTHWRVSNTPSSVARTNVASRNPEIFGEGRMEDSARDIVFGWFLGMQTTENRKFSARHAP